MTRLLKSVAEHEAEADHRMTGRECNVEWQAAWSDLKAALTFPPDRDYPLVRRAAVVSACQRLLAAAEAIPDELRGGSEFGESLWGEETVLQ